MIVKLSPINITTLYKRVIKWTSLALRSAPIIIPRFFQHFLIWLTITLIEINSITCINMSNRMTVHFSEFISLDYIGKTDIVIKINTAGAG